MCIKFLRIWIQFTSIEYLIESLTIKENLTPNQTEVNQPITCITNIALMYVLILPSL